MMPVGCFSLHLLLALRMTFENQYRLTSSESGFPFPKVEETARDNREHISISSRLTVPSAPPG